MLERRGMGRVTDCRSRAMRTIACRQFGWICRTIAADSFQQSGNDHEKITSPFDRRALHSVTAWQRSTAPRLWM